MTTSLFLIRFHNNIPRVFSQEIWLIISSHISFTPKLGSSLLISSAEVKRVGDVIPVFWAVFLNLMDVATFTCNFDSLASDRYRQLQEKVYLRYIGKLNPPKWPLWPGCLQSQRSQHLQKSRWRNWSQRRPRPVKIVDKNFCSAAILLWLHPKASNIFGLQK